MNEHPLRVNPTTWHANLEAAEESANFLIDYCRYLADDDDFRPNSSADCARILGTTKTDKDTLSELACGGSALAGAIIDARSAISRWSQLKAWRPYTLAGMVQPVWDSLGTPHGRYTSAGPCLNNRIQQIRETIEPDPGFSFLSLDLSQAEYVTWASLSGDPVLGSAFREGKDFHCEMADAVLLAVPDWDLRGQPLRDAGKTINFAILYQMQPHTLARKLGCSVKVAQKIIDAYYGRVPTADLYIRACLSAAKRTGYVETHFGRRRYCPEYQALNGDHGREAHETEKTLWNHINAGTAAELLKFKQARAWELLRTTWTADQVRLSIQNYDEAIFSVRDDLLPEAQALASEIWHEPTPGFLPFGVDVQTAKSWGEIK